MQNKKLSILIGYVPRCFKLLLFFLLYGGSSSGCMINFDNEQSIIRRSTQCASVVIAVPKSGSNLLTKCLGIILDRVSDDVVFGKDNLLFPQALFELSAKDLKKIINEAKKVVWHTHLMYAPESASVFIDTKTPFFFGYRDPRDVVVSMARFMKKLPDVWPAAINVCLNDIIMDLIRNNNLSNGCPPAQGIFDQYRKYLPWRNIPGCYAVRFENLVGVQGGGSDQLQLIEIKNIAQHVGVVLTDARAKKIAQNLFGGTWTFIATQDVAGQAKAGQIGSWKFVFTEEHKKAFKEVAGQLLIDLGYEQDFNW